MADPNVPPGSPTPRIEDSNVESHPFRAHFHGREDGTPGYLAVESGYIVPGGFFGGFDAILPKFAGKDLQDQRHTSDLTHIVDPPVGDYYIEATGEWRTTGYDGDNKIEMFEPHTAEVKHHSNLDLTHEKKRALKIFRLESDGRINQIIKSDIPMSLGRTTPAVPPWEEPPPPEPGSDSGSSASSDSSGSVSGSDSGYKSAAFEEQDYPPYMAPGATKNVQVTMFNDGTLPWAATDQLIPMGYDWGLFSVPVPVTYPGVPRPFNFEIYAPMTPGVYPFSWRLYGPAAYYGEQSPSVDITVEAPSSSSSGSGSGSGSSSGPAPYDRATYVSQHVIPEEMYVDEETWVQLVFRNTGETTWFPGTYKLIPLEYHWGMFEIGVPSVTPPGVDRTFDATMTAPSTPGTYYWKWMMEGPHGVFEQAGPSVPVIVSLRPVPPEPPSSSSGSSSSSPPPPSDSGSGGSSGSWVWEGSVAGENAKFVSQIIPIDIPAGGSTSVDVTFRNIGETVFTSGQHRLAAKTPDFNTFWTEGSVGLSAPIYPGAERTFHFWIEAPTTPGYYPWKWQFYNVWTSTFFGQTSPDRVILVTPPSDSGSSSS